MKKENIQITYQDVLDTFSSDHFFAVNKNLLRYYGPTKAVFLTNLIDKCLYFTRRGMTEDNWFFLHHKQQIAQTKLTEGEIRRAKKIFIQDGILETKKIGMPAKEWYYLHIEILVKTLKTKGLDLSKPKGLDLPKPKGLDLSKSKGLDLSKPKGLDLSKPKGLYNSSNKENKYKENKYTVAQKNSATELTPKKNKSRKKKCPIKKEHTDCAIRLRTIICENRNISSKPKIRPWAESINALVEKDGISIERINKALDWYAEYIGEKYTPEIWSGTSLRKKFIKLEAAIARSTGNYNCPSTTTKFEWTDKWQYKSCYLPAEQLLYRANDEDKTQLEQNILKTLTWFEKNQKRPKDAEIEYGSDKYFKWEHIPTASVFVKRYIDWVKDENWIKEINANMFLYTHKIFKQFFHQQQKRYMYNYFTGRSYA